MKLSLCKKRGGWLKEPSSLEIKTVFSRKKQSLEVDANVTLGMFLSVDLFPILDGLCSCRARSQLSLFSVCRARLQGRTTAQKEFLRRPERRRCHTHRVLLYVKRRSVFSQDIMEPKFRLPSCLLCLVKAKAARKRSFCQEQA